VSARRCLVGRVACALGVLAAAVAGWALPAWGATPADRYPLVPGTVLDMGFAASGILHVFDKGGGNLSLAWDSRVNPAQTPAFCSHRADGTVSAAGVGTLGTWADNATTIWNSSFDYGWWTTATYPCTTGATGPAAAVNDLTMPAAACSRSLAQNNGANVATFTGGPAQAAGMSLAYGWGFGDGTTAAAMSPQHIYPALSSMPAGGWTATLTVTATASAGHKFTDGASTKTATCALRIDFLNPSHSAAGGSAVDEQDDADCPSGWGWLNPLAFVRILKCLFVPQEPFDAGELVDDLASSFPGNWVAAVGSGFSTLVSEANAGLSNSAGGCGPDMGLNMNSVVEVPGDPSHQKAPNVHWNLPTPPGSGCHGSGANGARTGTDDQVGNLWGWRTKLRAGAAVFLWFAFARSMVMAPPWARREA
jgi:hypothetical protein